MLLAEYRGYGGLTAHRAMLPSSRMREQHGARCRTSHAPRAHHLHLRSALFGHSLGSAVAMELAAEIRATQPRAITAVVLQSPFTTAREMARIVSTRPVQVLWKLISRVHYDSRSRLDEIDAPIWISHGTRWLVPVAMGRELFAKSRTSGELLIVQTPGTTTSLTSAATRTGAGCPARSRRASGILGE